MGNQTQGAKTPNKMTEENSTRLRLLIAEQGLQR